MTTENDLTPETDIDEATEESSLVAALAPIAMIAAAGAGAVYFARKFVGRGDKEEVNPEVIEATSTEV